MYVYIYISSAYICMVHLDDAGRRCREEPNGSGINSSASLGCCSCNVRLYTSASPIYASPMCFPPKIKGQHIAHRKSTPQKSSCICSGIFQWMFSVIFQETITCQLYVPKDSFLPVDFHWNCPMDVQWHFPLEFHFCDFWCVIFCPEDRSPTNGGTKSRAEEKNLLKPAQTDKQQTHTERETGENQ